MRDGKRMGNGGRPAILRDCTASMVIYKNPPSMVRNAAESFLNTDCSVALPTVVDNSPTDALRVAFDGLTLNYHFRGENAGYGRAQLPSDFQRRTVEVPFW